MFSIKGFWVTVMLGVLGAVIYFEWFPQYAPTASLDLKYDRHQIISLARDYLSGMGYDTRALDADANLEFDSGRSLYLESKLGLPEAHRVLRRDTLSAHQWDIYFFDRHKARSQMRDRFNVWLSPTGRKLGFVHLLPDSIASQSVDETTARALAVRFLHSQGIDTSKIALENSTVHQRPHRRDYFFRWTRRDSVFGLASKIWVRVQGNKIGGFRHSLRAPDAYQQAGSKALTLSTFIVTGSSIATFVLLIFVVALFLKKYHDGEVGIKTAVGVFSVLFALTLVEQSLRFTTIGYQMNLADVNRFNVRIVVFIISVFIVQAFLAAMGLAGWSVGESSARRGWNEKLKAIDGIFYRKPFTLEFAHAVFRGYAFGFILLGVVLTGLYLASALTKCSLYVLTLNGIPESTAPALSVVLLALRVALLNEIVFRLFFISWLKEKTGKTWPGIVVSALIWTLIAFTLWDFPFGYIDFVYLFPAFFVIGMLLGVIVVRYDLLTAITANFVALSFTFAVPILVASANFYQVQSVLFYGLMVLPLILAVVGFIKRQQFTFTLELTPAHIRRISERERMARELEIARNVQMSLLPKANPMVEGYDIAGVCIPALEVGGDYYDFFHLGDNKFGIAIGDVSGKGVPAAIYMTLTKGILQSHAGESISPREVLGKLNRQMYRNIERNSFVSMFYAVLDMRNHKIRFARAGHNPAILAQRSNDSNTLLEPRGIAVGLEEGTKFNDFLEEHEVALHRGDVLTFYTDGFTEATTKDGEEYGEERLQSVISANKTASANMIIQSVVRSVKQFVGSHPQHDDMTMVVIKVL